MYSLLQSNMSPLIAPLSKRCFLCDLCLQLDGNIYIAEPFCGREHTAEENDALDAIYQIWIVIYQANPFHEPL